MFRNALCRVKFHFLFKMNKVQPPGHINGVYRDCVFASVLNDKYSEVIITETVFQGVKVIQCDIEISIILWYIGEF